MEDFRRTGYLLVSERVHVPDDLSSHLASVSGSILERSLNNRHDEGQGRRVNEVDELGVQQRLKARLGFPGRLRESIKQDGRDSWVGGESGVKTLNNSQNNSCV